MSGRGPRWGGGRGGRRDRDEPPPAVDPMARAMGLLARREHSARELARKLADGGAEADAIAATLSELGDRDLQSDQRFAELLVRSRIARGQGPIAIASELRSHGVDDANARAAVEAQTVDWAERARELCSRRFGASLGDPAGRRRCAAFLQRRGFPGALVREVLAGFSLTGESDDD
ncbi:MAG: regulatory protein RecX [Xanthomonadales bacterium]|nr:regulatory protein RecX [Xanthomonadales bacterium]